MNKKIIALTNVNIRESLGGQVKAVLQQFKTDYVIDGPFYHNGLRWWRVEDGFVAEETLSTPLIYFLNDETPFGLMFAFVLSQEGGLVDDPNDKGGVTKYGIAQRFNPDVDVKTLTIDQAKEIYRVKYYNPLAVENLGFDLALSCFDMAVNAGVSVAQNILLGSKTAQEFNNTRREFYKTLRQFNLYGNAWLSRVDSLERYLGNFNISS